MPQLALFLFGSPRVERNGTPFDVDRRKALALLAYLAVTRQRHRRDALATLLWPDQDQTRARAALRRVLATLNTLLDGDELEIDRETIGLRRDTALWIDVEQFQRLIDMIHTHGHAETDVCVDCLPLLSKAVALYSGDFLAGFTLRDSPDFDEWQFFQAESLRRMLTEVLERLSRGYSAQGDFDLAIAAARRWVSIDPLNESAHCQLMRVYAWAKQPSAALRHYQECARVLDQELGVAPSDTTTQLYEAIKAGQIPPLPDVRGVHRDGHAGTVRALSPIPTPTSLRPMELALPTPASIAKPPPLPNPPNSLIGREAELAMIAQWLADPTCRLVTLVGPGGIGKTRLALQAALDHLSFFAGKVYFVRLASQCSSTSLISAIAHALGLAINGDEDSEDQLIEALRDQALLLVLDNFEHFVPKARLLAEILEHTSAIKMLVTSRERLHLQSEWTLELEGLRIPEAETMGQAEEYGAVQLFVQRARRVHADFVLSTDDRQAVVRICQLVDGMPLGIELAAVWVRVLSCQEIVRELEANLEFLATSLHDVPARHQSLRAVFDHSWDLLTENERCVFRKLSIFQGGFSREAAEHVAGANLMVLAALVDKSLLRRGSDGRYALHELVHQYAAERLRAIPQENADVQERHGRYYLGLIQHHKSALHHEQPGDIVKELHAEIENLRAAWRWAVTNRHIHALDQGLDGMVRLYELQHHFQEAAKVLGDAIDALSVTDQAQLDDQHRLLMGKLLTRQGHIFRILGQYAQARSLIQRSMVLLEGSDVEEEVAQARQQLAAVALDLGEYREARQLLEANLAHYRLLGDDSNIAKTLSLLGYLLSEMGEYTQAMPLFEESLALHQSSGDIDGLSCVLNSMGYMYELKGDYTLAQSSLEKSLAISRSIGVHKDSMAILLNLGFVTAARHQSREAQEHFYEVLEIAVDAATTPYVLLAITGLAMVMAQTGNRDQAIELLSFTLNHPASNQETKDRSRCLLAELAADLGSETARVAINRSKGRTYEAVVEELLAIRNTVRSAA